MASYCLRWHENCYNSNHEAVAGKKAAAGFGALWGMSRPDFLHATMKMGTGLGRGTDLDSTVVRMATDMHWIFHMINPEDWDYIGDRGV